MRRLYVTTLFLLVSGVLFAQQNTTGAEGSLEILAVTAGTVEITGANVRQTVEVPAGRNTPVGRFNAGVYRVVIRYEDGNTEERTIEIRSAQTERLVFRYRRLTGSLEIRAVIAGTVEITGDNVNRTVEVPAGRSVPIGEFNVGSYRVVMRYEDGNTEERTIEVKAAQTERLEFRNIRLTGSLEIRAFIAGTVEITGTDVHQTAEVPAGRSLSVGEFDVGDYRVVMSYNDGETEEKTVEIRSAQVARLEFTRRRLTGSLEIRAVIAGTVEITGTDVHRTAEVPAGENLPVGEFNEGSYRVVMSYNDGKTEERTVEIRPEQDIRLKFNYRPPERLNSLGGSLGFTFSAPLFAGAIQATLAPWGGSFFDLGVDIGMGSGKTDIKVEYFSLYPYARFAFFAPFTKGGGWYAGAGAGLMIAFLSFPEEGKITGFNVAADLSTGVIFRNGINLSYTFRTDFNTANSKLAVGYLYRFR